MNNKEIEKLIQDQREEWNSRIDELQDRMDVLVELIRAFVKSFDEEKEAEPESDEEIPI